MEPGSTLRGKPTWNKSDLDDLKQQTDEILEEIEEEEAKP
jgi:hypothetical protein